jgi:hypothetical protein
MRVWQGNTSMDNRGKLWSIDDDQKLMESPQLPNAYFSQSMGRSENAIKMRRSHLAAKMHQNDPSTSLEEYVGLMGGELEHAAQLLQEWSEKRATFKSFLDTNRKRKAQEFAPPPAEPQRSRFFAPPPQQPPDVPNYWHDNNSPELRIDAICKSIREEGGNLASVFNDPQYLPILIQHYPGFEAYARIVQARQ